MKISPRLPLLAALAVLSLFPSSAGATESTESKAATETATTAAPPRLASFLRPDVHRAEWRNLVFRQLRQGTIAVHERNHRLDRKMHA